MAPSRSRRTLVRIANAGSVLLLPVLALVFQGCGTYSASGAVRILGQANGAPAGCTPKAVAGRLESTFEAISTGDPNVIDEFFGRQRGAPFEWFTMNSSGAFAARSWDDLASTLQQRYEQHERLKLLTVRFNGWEQGRGLIHLSRIVASRSAADLEPGQRESEFVAEGKGAYHCSSRAAVVISLATESQ